MTPLVELEGITFDYLLGTQKLRALTAVSCSIAPGAFLCLSGPSGSGKSTLLNLLGLIEPVQEGRLLWAGRDLRTMGEKDKNRLRKFDIGFVFQSFHLFPVLSAQENIEYFLARQGVHGAGRTERARKALESVGLADHRGKKPLEMSGGQRQRVAVARALAKQPKVIIADEPTASLDQATGREIMGLFKQAHERTGAAFVVSSHDPMVQALCPQRLQLQDGMLQ